MWKNNTALLPSLHGLPPCDARPLLRKRSPPSEPLPPPRHADRKEKGILPFMVSCSARMMSIRELSRECMFRLSYILERSCEKTQAWGLKTNPQSELTKQRETLISHVSNTLLRFGSRMIKPLKSWYLASLTCKRFKSVSSSRLD